MAREVSIQIPKSRLLVSLHKDVWMGCSGIPFETQVRLEIPNKREKERKKKELTMSSILPFPSVVFL